MKILKIVFISIGLLVFIQPAKAQLGKLRSEIIKDRGTPDSIGVTNDGTRFIRYFKDETSEISGKYLKLEMFYFDKDNICDFKLIGEPRAEVNSWIKFLSKDFVELGKMKWKDYSKNIIYSIEIKDTIMILNIYYDEE